MADSKADPRADVMREIDAAFQRLAAKSPEHDAALMLRLAVGYLADQYARHFGHAEAVKMLTETAKRGVQHAAQELAAPRH